MFDIQFRFRVLSVCIKAKTFRGHEETSATSLNRWFSNFSTSGPLELVYKTKAIKEYRILNHGIYCIPHKIILNCKKIKKYMYI